MRVLVTGGAGFIGSHVVDRLRIAGHEPVIYDVRRSPWPEHADVEQVQGSLLDRSEVSAALAGCDAVAHLAAAADVGEVAKEPAWAEELNSRGTLNVLEAARETGVRRVVYASTIWVYDGAAAADRVDEDTPLGAPAHLYTATKLAGEHYCVSYAELYGLEPTILRFGIPYGPRARPAAVIPAFTRKALAGEPLTIAGTGEQSRRFVYVEDLAEGVVRGLAPAAAGRVYNLVSEEDTSVKEIATAVREVVGDVRIEHTPGRAGDFAGAVVCGNRARAELGWEATTPFAEGLRSYVEWHRDHDAQEAAAASPAPVASTSSSARRGLLRQLPAGALLRSAAVVLAALLALFAGLALTGLHLSDDERAFAFAALLAGGAGLAGEAELLGARRLALVLGWSTALLFALVVAFDPFHDALGLAHLGRSQVLLLVSGAVAGLVLAVGGRRVLQPSDA